MRRFLRKSAIRQEPLPVAMSGVRMGERVLQVGVDDARVAGTIAARTGLSGQATIVVANEADAARARAATIEAGILADVHAAPFGGSLPISDASFDAIVVHTMHGLMSGLGDLERQQLLRECFRVLRPGGRLLVVEAGRRSGLSAIFRSSPSATGYDHSGGAVSALQLSGFKPVRVLAERDGFKFTEGLKAS